MSFRKFFRGYKRKRQVKHTDGNIVVESGPSGSEDEWEDTMEETVEAMSSEPLSGARYNHQISETEFTCACCFELIVEPTTLTCGHNFCRLCVARWFLQSKKRKCIECRQPWSGNPQVNITLRSTIERLFGERYQQRKTAVEQDPSCKKILKDFTDKMNQETAPVLTRAHIRGRRFQIQGNKAAFFTGILAAVAAFLVWCLFQYMFSSRSELASQKPVLKWTTDDVTVWLQELGPWTEENLIAVFKNNSIDGHLLMVLTEEDLDDLLRPVNLLHQRAFKLSLFSLRELGIKPPADLWQYKDMHLGWSIFLLYYLRAYPRSTIVYVFFVAYADCFLPLMHITCPVLHDIQHLNLYTFQFPKPTLGQWIDFSVKWVMFPYIIILQFAWRSGHSLILTFCVTTTCAICTALEANTFLTFVKRRNFKNFARAEWRELYTTVRNTVFGCLIFSFIPTFICNLLFSSTLYTMPFSVGNILYKQLYTT